METKDKLVNMLEKNPKLFKIINSTQHIQILKEISKDSKELSNLKKDTHFKKDTILYNIVESLISNKLVKKINVKNNEIYYITDEGKSFLSLYENGQKKFNI